MEKDADTENAQAFQHSAQSPETDTQSFEHKVVGLRLNLTHRKRAYQTHKSWARFTRFFVVVVLVLAAGVVGYYYRADILPSDTPTPPAPPATLEPQTASVAPETISEIAPHMPPSSHTQEEEPGAAEQAASSSAADNIDSSGAASAAGADDTSGALQTSPPTNEAETAPAETPGATTPARPDAILTEVPAAVSTPAPESPAAVAPVPETSPAETPKALAKEPELSVAQQSPPTAPAPPLNHIRIAGSQACVSVQARQCRGAQENFTIREHAKPYVWMLVYSKSLPYVLRHVYYHEGRQYVQVPLAIKHKRMRTWSTITLRGLAHVGSWRVDIEAADGTVLDQVEFQVSP